MHQRVILVYSHDSIGLGEDGPTHQPIEHLNSLRLIPNLTLWRPADAAETAAGLVRGDRTRHRSDLPGPHASGIAAACARHGGARGHYAAAAMCWPTARARPECLVIATGSEVQIALEAVRHAAVAGQARAAGVDAVHASCSTRRMPPIVNRCCRGGDARASRSRPAPPGCGGAMSAPPGASSVSITMAPRAKDRSCSKNSASRPMT